jgi:hypothetical protein
MGLLVTNNIPSLVTASSSDEKRCGAAELAEMIKSKTKSTGSRRGRMRGFPEFEET